MKVGDVVEGMIVGEKMTKPDSKYGARPYIVIAAGRPNMVAIMSNMSFPDDINEWIGEEVSITCKAINATLNNMRVYQFKKKHQLTLPE